MKKIFIGILSVLSILLMQCGTTSRFNDFVTAKKDKLMEGSKQLRFVSYNIPNLLYIEDYFPFASSNPWRLPTAFEIRDALKAIKMSGGKVARIYTLSVRRKGESPNIIKYVLGPGKFNEKAFRTLDKVLQIANEEGVRLIIPFVDNWWWWGGRAEYAAFRGKKPDDFWTDPQLISDFEKTINFVLNRKNTYTGVLYKNDKAVLGWETGNELEAPYSWQNTIAAYIKSIDKNHLVLEGTHAQVLTQKEVDDPNFDALSTHYYSPINKAIPDILKNRELTKDKKPYFVGEFGYRKLKDTKTIVDTAISDSLAGIMIWSMRFHARSGGFYQHGEAYSGSYRFPGFPSGKLYHEKQVIDFMRASAYRINGEKEPPMPIPDAPNLLNIKDVYDISWQGSTGASYYSIQRKTNGRDNWNTIADSVSDADVVFRPLFDDTTAELGKSYYYRVFAHNISGSSPASNEVGPVEVNYKKFIDELKDSTKIFERSDSVQYISNKNDYRAKEDNNRLQGVKGSYVIYKMPSSIDSIRVEVFLAPPYTGKKVNRQCGLSFYASDSLSNFKPLAAKIETYPPYRNFYRFYTPAVYTCGEFPVHSTYLKIEFTDAAQLSRVEIIYSKLEKPNPDIVTVP